MPSPSPTSVLPCDKQCRVQFLCSRPLLILSVLGLVCGAAGLGPGITQAATPDGSRADTDTWAHTWADTWIATDGLGRTLPTSAEVGPPRADRTVGIFYFLWHGAHAQGGPYDISRILARDPAAMTKPDSPLWGPLHVPHHWGESIFGHYRLQDDGLLRKHAQMLADAGVDTVIFDVSNQVTYRDDYLALMRVWQAARASGNRTPQVAFLVPFWDPSKVVHELWRDLYSKGLHRDLWFAWEGRPLILADPELLDRRRDRAAQDTAVELRAGETLGQQFHADEPFRGVGGRFPTWRTTNAAVTLALFRDGPGGALLATKTFNRVVDNSWLQLPLSNNFPAGGYYLEASKPSGKIGWWSTREDQQPHGHATSNGVPVAGDRTLRLILSDSETDAIRGFFTFRKPQPDYFQGPTRPDMWSWLEVYPQHVFRNARGEKEQMSVGVAQNAVGGRLGSMSEAGAFGRSRHHGSNDLRADAVHHGFNFAEQAGRALREDPRFVFITGWNEWIAGRFREFNGVREPVMFVDQFDQEHSRDIEPMRGGHDDHYFYQMAAFIRRYKGARSVPFIRPGPVRIDGRFGDWAPIAPEYQDTVDDPVHRHAPAWDSRVVYRDDTGRNDLVAAKVSFDRDRAFFYIRARSTLSPATDSNWMVLFLEVDANSTNGWLGYDFVVNRTKPGSLEKAAGAGFRWTPAGTGAIEWAAAGSELELAIAWSALGFPGPPAQLDFKWGDGLKLDGTWSDFTLHGDAAPNDRFRYRAVLKR